MLAFCQPIRSGGTGSTFGPTRSKLSVSGVGATKDSNCSFDIEISKGVGIITPTIANELSGWVHFTLPTPSGSSSSRAALRRVDLDFDAVEAYIDEVEVFVGSSKVHHIERGDRQTRSFGQSIPGVPAYTGGGISVSVLVGFDDLDGSITFNCVSVEN
ncbi:hypothetical protein QBC44DRAFT_95429 [Cladorrhinum sp. PSN332]|nr:hypothetical protein QBC44DRAFT_95429 [Cladorrhinum sp. PSN332]